MEIEKGIAYKANGIWFDTEQQAKDYLFEARLREWFLARHATPQGILEGHVGHICNTMIEDRMKLLPIFKTLNGGSPVTAPAKVLPETPPAELVDVEMRLIDGGKS